MCSTTMIVIFESLICLIKQHASSASLGFKPAINSSRRSKLGLAARARANSSRLRCIRVRSLARTFALSPSPTRSRISAIPLPPP